jgi:hypothetical protein
MMVASWTDPLAAGSVALADANPMVDIQSSAEIKAGNRTPRWVLCVSAAGESENAQGFSRISQQACCCWTEDAMLWQIDRLWVAAFS